MPDFVAPQLTEKSLQETRRAVGCGDLYVFGYGSLMWRPGFRFIECSVAEFTAIIGVWRFVLGIIAAHLKNRGWFLGLIKAALATACCIAWATKKQRKNPALFVSPRNVRQCLYARFVAASPEDGRAHNGFGFCCPP